MAKKTSPKAGAGCAALIALLPVIGGIIGISSHVGSQGQASENASQSLYDSSSSDDRSSDETPVVEVTSTPAPVIVPDVAAETPADARTTLIGQGFVVVLQDGGGAPVADSTGWTIARQTAAGASVVPGSTVVLTHAAPAAVAPAPAPAAPVAPGGGATALCRDGSYSYAAHHQGACSHHGGVAEFYK